MNTKTDWTAEEVREVGRILRKHSNGLGTFDYEAADMLTAFAERIEADESAVPIYQRKQDGNWQDLSKDQYDRVYDCPLTTTRVLFTHPPAQPAQEQPGWKVPDGWRLVPIKATEKMRQEGAPHAGYEEEEAYSLDAVWAAMLTASPTPPKEK